MVLLYFAILKFWQVFNTVSKYIYDIKGDLVNGNICSTLPLYMKCVVFESTALRVIDVINLSRVWR